MAWRRAASAAVARRHASGWRPRSIAFCGLLDRITGPDLSAAAAMAFLPEFLALSAPSQAVVLLVIGTATWIVLRLTLRVLRLLLWLLPERKPAAASPEPRQVRQGA